MIKKSKDVITVKTRRSLMEKGRSGGGQYSNSAVW